MATVGSLCVGIALEGWGQGEVVQPRHSSRSLWGQPLLQHFPLGRNSDSLPQQKEMIALERLWKPPWG